MNSPNIQGNIEIRVQNVKKKVRLCIIIYTNASISLIWSAVCLWYFFLFFFLFLSPSASAASASSCSPSPSKSSSDLDLVGPEFSLLISSSLSPPPLPSSHSSTSMFEVAASASAATPAWWKIPAFNAGAVREREKREKRKACIYT